MAKVLILDDDPVILCVAEGALESAGHEVIASTDPRKAVSLAVEHAVDAIVLDINMPDLSGYETLDALRAHPRTGGLPILFLSSLSESRHRIRGLRHGANDYLVKPFEPEELVLRVEHLAAQQIAAAGPADPLPADLEQALATGEIHRTVYLGRYQLLERVGKGAMGVVFRGWDPRLKRPVALKTIRFETSVSPTSEDLQARLSDEAATLARFNHPNIVMVFDLEHVRDVACVVMEYVDGISLSEHLSRRGKLPASRTGALALEVARGLSAAHENGVVHRDVKPGNVLLGFDHAVKVSDFGLAGFLSGLDKSSKLVYGTPGFMPPESLQGDVYDEAGDLFAFGAILYQCLTGRHAFEGKTMRQRMLRTLEVDPPLAHEVEESVPEDLSHLVRDLLRKDPAARPSSAREVVARLLEMAGPEAPPWTLEHTEAHGESTPEDGAGSVGHVGHVGHVGPV